MRIITALAFVLIAFVASAQSALHEYCSVQFLTGWGKMFIVSTISDTEIIDFTAAEKKDANLWMKFALNKVKELEVQGWEIQDFATAGPNGSTFVWVMRKPKQ